MLDTFRVLKLYQWGEAFFILNGHDAVLVSVLKALGQRTIRAYVMGPDEALAPPPTIKFLEQWEREVQRDLRRGARRFFAPFGRSMI